MTLFFSQLNQEPTDKIFLKKKEMEVLACTTCSTVVLKCHGLFNACYYLQISYLFMLFNQALKFCNLAITIYHYCNFDLVVVNAKILQNFLETTKNKIALLKRRDLKCKIHYSFKLFELIE